MNTPTIPSDIDTKGFLNRHVEQVSLEFASILARGSIQGSIFVFCQLAHRFWSKAELGDAMKIAITQFYFALRRKTNSLDHRDLTEIRKFKKLNGLEDCHCNEFELHMRYRQFLYQFDIEVPGTGQVASPASLRRHRRLSIPSLASVAEYGGYQHSRGCVRSVVMNFQDSGLS